MHPSGHFQQPRKLLAALGQTAVMAAVVATLAYLPVAALAALFGYGALGISLQAFASFGGRFSEVGGLLVWWCLFFVAAFVYAAWGMSRRSGAP